MKGSEWQDFFEKHETTRKVILPFFLIWYVTKCEIDEYKYCKNIGKTHRDYWDRNKKWWYI